MRVFAIDPGITGGISLLTDDGLLSERMPVGKVNGKAEIDLGALAEYLRVWEPDVVWIEQQQALPKQGVSSTFRTGYNYGLICGLVLGCGIPLKTVRPAVWKKAMKVPADKTEARMVASRLFPKQAGLWAKKCEDGVAESALLALYGRSEGAI